MFKYAPMYRPPGFASLPKGWTLLERPRLNCGFDRRTDLPLSRHMFGVVSYDRQLTDAEVTNYQLEIL